MPPTGSVHLFDERERSTAIDALVRHAGDHVVLAKVTGHGDALRGSHCDEASDLCAAHLSGDFAFHPDILRALKCLAAYCSPGNRGRAGARLPAAR
jgi:hypothetical protein